MCKCRNGEETWQSNQNAEDPLKSGEELPGNAMRIVFNAGKPKCKECKECKKKLGISKALGRYLAKTQTEVGSQVIANTRSSRLWKYCLHAGTEFAETEFAGDIKA